MNLGHVVLLLAVAFVGWTLYHNHSHHAGQSLI